MVHWLVYRVLAVRIIVLGQQSLMRYWKLGLNCPQNMWNNVGSLLEFLVNLNLGYQ